MTSATFLSVTLPPGADHLVPKLEQTFLDTIALAVVEALPEDKLETFEQLLAAGDASDVIDFIEANVPDAREEINSIARQMHSRLAAFS